MKVGVLLSGGVDSSVVCAELAQKTDYNITAYYLKIWLEDELSFLGDCPWEKDLSYAKAVCEKYNIPLKIISLQTQYHERVVSYTLDELKKGFTPSPDIFCNQMIKFGAFWEEVQNEVDFVASGHYVTLRKDGDSVQLVKGVDLVKDQSYFLSHLSQDQLSRCIFPLGAYQKEDVRKKAAEYDLPTKDRKDSQGICFLGQIKYNEFVDFHLGQKDGDIVNQDSGEVLGRHKGYWYHTVGQRRGLNLGNGPWYVSGKDVEKNVVYVRHQSLKKDLNLGNGPWYVSGKDVGKNVVYVRHQSLKKDLNQRKFIACEPHWISGESPPLHKSYEVKLRHGPQRQLCQITQVSESLLSVELEQGDQGIADGQFAVFYDQDICLGAAKISSHPIGK